MFKSSYQRNIPLLGLTEFFGFFGITSFWLVFLSQNGMTLWQIGLLESLFHGTSLVSEIPSGILADRFSYKLNLYLSRIATIVSSLLMLIGHGQFWIYALGMMISAWGYNFDSGTSTAMLYESMKEDGQENRYLKVSSFLSGVAEATRTLGTVAAGFFIHGFLDVTYYIQIVMSLCVIGFIFLMKEPKVKVKNEDHQSVKAIIETVKQSFQMAPKLLYWMLYTQIIGVIMCMFYFYYQNEIDILASWQISLIMLVSSGINIFAVWLASRIGDSWSDQHLFIVITIITGLLYAGAIWNLPVWYAVIYLLTDGLYAMFLPVYNTSIQQQLPSQVRATMLSVNAMFYSLSMIIIFPATGWLIDTIGFSSSFLGLGLALIIIAIVTAVSLSKTRS